jgi:hypothetical protein
VVVNFTSCVFSKMAEALTCWGLQGKVYLHTYQKANPMLQIGDRFKAAPISTCTPYTHRYIQAMLQLSSVNVHSLSSFLIHMWNLKGNFKFQRNLNNLFIFQRRKK